MKTCRVCEIEKDEADFERKRNQCRPCTNKRKTAYWIGKEELRKANFKAWYNANREKNIVHSKEWKEANPEKAKAIEVKRVTDVEKRWVVLVRSANRRGKFIDTDQINSLKKKMTESCFFYCGFVAPKGHRLNGLDCVDPKGGYTVINAVPACTPCNLMKVTKTIDSFIYHVRRVRCELATGPPESLPRIVRRSSWPYSLSYALLGSSTEILLSFTDSLKARRMVLPRTRQRAAFPDSEDTSNPNIEWHKHPATDFHALFEEYMVV